MPLSEDDLWDSRKRVYGMFIDTIQTFEKIDEKALELFGIRSRIIRDAIRECLDDFYNRPEKAGQPVPEAAIFNATLEDFQRSGFYGAQLALKEDQVTKANKRLRASLEDATVGGWSFIKRPFKWWIDIINNFLGSLVKAAGIGEALQELKDCLLGEIPDEEQDDE